MKRARGTTRAHPDWGLAGVILMRPALGRLVRGPVRFYTTAPANLRTRSATITSTTPITIACAPM
jgi:hypothetical protein